MIIYVYMNGGCNVALPDLDVNVNRFMFVLVLSKQSFTNNLCGFCRLQLIPE
jgi:hypothetical protein